MKQIKITNAYAVTDALANDPSLTLKGKWAFYSLRKALAPHYDFQVEENKRLTEKYKGTYDPSTNMINFESPEIRDEFVKEHNDLDNLEVDITFSKQKLSLTDVPKITISQIEALEDFIEFIPE